MVDMAIPSQASSFNEVEGVETRRQGSDLSEQGIVQIINLKRVMKMTVIRITDWSLVRFQPGPPLYKHRFYNTKHLRSWRFCCIIIMCKFEKQK